MAHTHIQEIQGLFTIWAETSFWYRHCTNMATCYPDIRTLVTIICQHKMKYCNFYHLASQKCFHLLCSSSVELLYMFMTIYGIHQCCNFMELSKGIASINYRVYFFCLCKTIQTAKALKETSHLASFPHIREKTN